MIRTKRLYHGLAALLAGIALLCGLDSQAQDTSLYKHKSIFFPYPMTRNWTTSIGFTNTTMPYDVTEEAHFRIPAIDFHVIRRLGGKFYLDGRVSAQVLQNLVTMGPRWATPLSKRLSLGLGNDIGYWFGIINLQGIKTKGHGFENLPNVSLGLRFNRKVLLTLRADAIMDFGIRTYAADLPATTNYRLFSGSSYSLILEQPFYGSKHLSLGFRAIYTNFFWQTWTLFETFDRNIFYPQIIVGLQL